MIGIQVDPLGNPNCLPFGAQVCVRGAASVEAAQSTGLAAGSTQAGPPNGQAYVEGKERVRPIWRLVNLIILEACCVVPRHRNNDVGTVN